MFMTLMSNLRFYFIFYFLNSFFFALFLYIHSEVHLHFNRPNIPIHTYIRARSFPLTHIFVSAVHFPISESEKKKKKETKK